MVCAIILVDAGAKTVVQGVSHFLHLCQIVGAYVKFQQGVVGVLPGRAFLGLQFGQGLVEQLDAIQDAGERQRSAICVRLFGVKIVGHLAGVVH